MTVFIPLFILVLVSYLWNVYKMVQKAVSKQRVCVCQVVRSKYHAETWGRKRDRDSVIAL